MPKVIVAMSGGVDSSVVAAILKNRLFALGGGYDVVGIFLLMHKDSNPRDAKIVAKKLGIDFKVLDVRKEFKKRVVDYFIKEYKSGNTPNPCVECNKHIKFKFLIDIATKLKVDFIATGHYAKIKFVNSKPIRYSLMTALDKQKDQSYFLWQLNQKQLSKILFPLGDCTKEQVRGMAREFKLPVAEKKDSQEVCFVNICIEDFLKKYIKAKPGPIITTEGKKIGEHKGLVFYTIGQRRGIEVGGIGPFYVVGKDFKKNALIVAQSDFNPALFKKEMKIKNTNWLARKPYKGKCNVKIRYGHKVVPCSVFKIRNSKLNQNSKFKIVFNAPQRAITPGQSAVFYLRNQVMGGGVIM